MTFTTFLAHLLGFVAPAIGLAILLTLVLRWGRGQASWRRELGWLVGAGVLVLLVGLGVFGRDGKMLTYAALVLVQGTLAATLQRR